MFIVSKSTNSLEAILPKIKDKIHNLDKFNCLQNQLLDGDVRWRQISMRIKEHQYANQKPLKNSTKLKKQLWEQRASFH